MTELEANNIQLFILIPMLIEPDLYRSLDPDEPVDQTYIAALQKEDSSIHSRMIQEQYQPLFLTEDFKAVFRPTAIEFTRTGLEQGVQAIVPSLNMVVHLKWRFETMCNLALLTLEIDLPPFTTMNLTNDLLDIIQHDTFSWEIENGWLVPHRSITQLLDIEPDMPVGLAHLITAFEKVLHTKAIIKAQNPFLTFLLQMNLRGDDKFSDASRNFGEYLLAQRYGHISTLLGYHEYQQPFIGTNWRGAQNLDSAGWFEWQTSQYRNPPLPQHRYTADAIFTSSMQRRRAARRVFKIATMDYIAVRLIDHLLASQGESSRLRKAIHELWRNQGKTSALYYDVLFKLSRLEARYLLLNNNLINPDWILDNPFGEGNSFIHLMSYMQHAFSIHSHLQSLREQLGYFNRLLDRHK